MSYLVFLIVIVVFRLAADNKIAPEPYQCQWCLSYRKSLNNIFCGIVLSSHVSMSPWNHCAFLINNNCSYDVLAIAVVIKNLGNRNTTIDRPSIHSDSPLSHPHNCHHYWSWHIYCSTKCVPAKNNVSKNILNTQRVCLCMYLTTPINCCCQQFDTTLCARRASTTKSILYRITLTLQRQRGSKVMVSSLPNCWRSWHGGYSRKVLSAMRTMPCPSSGNNEEEEEQVEEEHIFFPLFPLPSSHQICLYLHRTHFFFLCFLFLHTV